MVPYRGAGRCAPYTKIISDNAETGEEALYKIIFFKRR